MGDKEGSEVFLGVGAVAGLVLGVVGLILHVWTIVIAYSVSGLFLAFVSLVLPVLSEVYWFFKVGSNAGFGSVYCVSILVYFVILGVLQVAAKLLESLQ